LIDARRRGGTAAKLVSLKFVFLELASSSPDPCSIFSQSSGALITRSGEHALNATVGPQRNAQSRLSRLFHAPPLSGPGLPDFLASFLATAMIVADAI
jgi:hypothetical protein